MEENTAQNNSIQFPYPDFSTTAPQQQTQPINQVQPVSQVQTPTTPAPSDEESLQSQSGGIVKDTDKEEKTYTQEVTPVPGLEKDVEEVPTPLGEGFDPLPSDLPKFTETLDRIMPDPHTKKDTKEDVVQVVEPEEVSAPAHPEPTKFSKESHPSDGELTMQKLLSEAINRNASDLHLAVSYPPILRIDGELVSLDERSLSPVDTETLIFSVLNDEKKELLEVNREIDFAYTYDEGATKARFRVNAYYSMKNLSAAFRLIPSRVKTVEELMLPQIYNQFAKLQQGLILVTGPTGHGKSTTIAAVLEAINRTRFCHIVTIEDPIEYVFEGKKALIDQREMNDDTHSWNVALRSALRQDPDVILVGEMRDFETISSAITLAETGHLVFATLHTNSASQTLDRIIDVFPENQQQQVRTQIATTLEAVVAQRLIPLDQGGRRAVSEIMLNNSAVSNMIREGKMHQIDNVIRTSSDIGMVYLERSLVNLVREGVISVQKAQDYAVHPEEVLRLLNR